MATITAPNRTIIGWFFVVGGALQVLGAIVSLANAGNSSAIYAISNIAIGVGFALMFAWLAGATIARVAYFIAAIGWLLLALGSLVSLGPVGSLALYIAIIGSVFAGVVVMSGRVLSGRADILFLVAMIVGAANLLLSQNGNVPSLLEALVVIVFGVALVFAGVAMFRRR